MKVHILGTAHTEPLARTYPLYASSVAAGFPSPADDYIEQDIDLHEYLVKNPPATFFVRADGDSMEGAGIFSGDILIVDRSQEAISGDIVIAVLDGELTVKRLHRDKHGISLVAENELYDPIHIPKESEFTLWGIVTFVLHKCR